LREVGALEEAGGGAVGADGLVVLAFCGEGMGEADPGGAEVWVHGGRFAEEAARFGDAMGGEVIYADCEPGGRFVRVSVGQLVGEQEKRILFAEFVEAGKMGGKGGEIVGGEFEDACREGGARPERHCVKRREARERRMSGLAERL